MRKLLLSTALLLGMTLPSMALQYNNFRQGCHTSAWLFKEATDGNASLNSFKNPEDVKTFLSRLDKLNGSTPDDLLTGDAIYFLIRSDGNGINFVILENDQTCGVWTASLEEFDNLSKDLRAQGVVN